MTAVVAAGLRYVGLPLAMRTVAGKGQLAISNGQSITRAIAVVPKSRRSRILTTSVLSPTGRSIHFYGDAP